MPPVYRCTIDPTDAAQRASITANTGAYPWFCQYYGCDYTVRVTYQDGSQFHALLQSGFRSWFGAINADVDATAKDQVNANSFRTWAVNVPGDKQIAQIDLFDTPQAWKGVDLTLALVLTHTVP